jgi:hypothetical protein
MVVAQAGTRMPAHAFQIIPVSVVQQSQQRGPQLRPSCFPDMDSARDVLRVNPIGPACCPLYPTPIAVMALFVNQSSFKDKASRPVR